MARRLSSRPSRSAASWRSQANPLRVRYELETHDDQREGILQSKFLPDHRFDSRPRHLGPTESDGVYSGAPNRSQDQRPDLGQIRWLQDAKRRNIRYAGASSCDSSDAPIAGDWYDQDCQTAQRQKPYRKYS